MPKGSYRSRLAVLLLGLVALVQFPTFVSVYFATHGNAIDQARARLEVGARVFERLLASRKTQLADALGVAASDFGFREAVATRDGATVQSVLINHGARIGASFGLILDLDGNVTTSTSGIAERGIRSFEGLLAHADANGVAGGLLASDGEPYQVVLVPVRAPQRIGWVGMGFPMNDELARQLRTLTRLEVSFAARGPNGRNVQSTLPPPARRALAVRLADAGSDARPGTAWELDGEEYLTHVVVLDDDATIDAVLQIPMEEVLEPFHQLNSQLLAISTLSFLLSVGGAWLLARGVTRPVKQLADAANRIERGEYGGELDTSRSDEFGRLATAFNGMQRGIAEREQRITHLAYHDALTDLPNRINIERRLIHAMEPGSGIDRIAVLVIDVNHFKEINDTLGHPIGDRLLVNVGRRLHDSVDPGDVVARLGSDEFLVMLLNRDVAHAQSLAARLVRRMSAPVLLGTMELFPSISIGIALFPEHAGTAEDLLRRADIAMYDAKHAHAPVHMYMSGRDALHLRRLSLVNDLRRASANEEFEVHYQPKMDLRTGRITAVEALVRWRHPREGIIPPDEFIPLAEHSGSVHLVTEWMLRRVIAQRQAWRHAGIELDVAINISAMDLTSDNLAARLQACLGEAGADPYGLILEVTESAIMRDAVRALEMMRRLRMCGVRLAIDDFGTGHSSLSQLKRMPVDELKIDKSFVMDMSEDADDAVIVRSTIELGHNMGLKVVAEGVDDSRTLDLLEAWRCDMAQGFLISRPLPVAELETFIARANARTATSLALPP